MKKLLLVMVFLAVAAPAGAEVLVYTMSEKSISFTEGSPEGEMNKDKLKGFAVFDVNTADETADMWVIVLEKGRDPNGEPQKQVSSYREGVLDIIRAEAGKKQYWIIADSRDRQKTMFTGQVKPTAIDSETWLVAKKLTGTGLWDKGTDASTRDIGSKHTSLYLDSKYTIYAKEQVLNAKKTTKKIVKDLVDEKGYVEVAP